MARPARSLLALTLLLSACDGDMVVDSDYDLQLIPRLMANQDLFADGPQVNVVIREPTNAYDKPGPYTVHTLGEISGGEVEGHKFEPLDEAMVGVLLQQAGTTEDIYDLDALIAYGEVGPITLGAEGLEEVHELALSAFGGVGQMGELDYPAAGAVAELTRSGSVVMVGGGSFDGSVAATDSIRLLADLDEGEWTFTEVGTISSPRVWAAGTMVLAGDDELTDPWYLFVSGGRSSVDVYEGTYDWWLIDPQDGSVIASDDSMIARRAEHQAVRALDGRVLLVGGVDNDQSYLPHQASWEWFDPISRDFEFGGEIDPLPALGFGAASLGEDGTLLCGGGDWYATSGDPEMTPVNTCVVVPLFGDYVEVTSLPSARNFPAMATLSDGRVLVSGGLSDAFPLGDDTGTASASAWLYDPVTDGWSVASDMNFPRAYHRIVPTPDGRAIVIGGSSSGGYAADEDPGPTVDCPEIFDVETMGFTVSDHCAPGGSGAHPLVASHPAHGLFVAAGLGEGGDALTDFGLVGLPLPPSTVSQER